MDYPYFAQVMQSYEYFKDHFCISPITIDDLKQGHGEYLDEATSGEQDPGQPRRVWLSCSKTEDTEDQQIREDISSDDEADIMQSYASPTSPLSPRLLAGVPPEQIDDYSLRELANTIWREHIARRHLSRLSSQRDQLLSRHVRDVPSSRPRVQRVQLRAQPVRVRQRSRLRRRRQRLAQPPQFQPSLVPRFQVLPRRDQLDQRRVVLARLEVLRHAAIVPRLAVVHQRAHPQRPRRSRARVARPQRHRRALQRPRSIARVAKSVVRARCRARRRARAREAPSRGAENARGGFGALEGAARARAHARGAAARGDVGFRALARQHPSFVVAFERHTTTRRASRRTRASDARCRRRRRRAPSARPC